MAKSTVEHRAMINATVELTNAVKNELTSLSLKLVAKELISVDQGAELRNGNIGVLDRAAHLVTLVTNKVEQDKKNFYHFIEVLIGNRSAYRKILESLEPIYKRGNHIYNRCVPAALTVNQPWYHKKLSREDAEKRLGEINADSFLVRESTQGHGKLVLSIKNGVDFYHFPIERVVGFYQIEGTDKPFSSVVELVDHYKQCGLPEGDSGEVVLIESPCSDSSLCSTVESCPHTSETGTPQSSNECAYTYTDENDERHPQQQGEPATGKGTTASASADVGRPESQQPAERASSPFQTSLLPPIGGRPLSPQQRPLSQVSPEPPKVQQQQQPQASSHANAKQRHRVSYSEVNSDQEIRVEPLPIQMRTTNNDMWVKTTIDTAGCPPHQDSLEDRDNKWLSASNVPAAPAPKERPGTPGRIFIDIGGGPRHPPPPPPNKRPPQQQQQQQRVPLSPTADATDADEHDYSDLPHEFSSSSPETLSPVHQTSPLNPLPHTTTTTSASSHSHHPKPPPVAARRSKEDIFSGKPAPPKKPGALAISKGAAAGAASAGVGRLESQQPAARANSSFQTPLLPSTGGRPLPPQQSPLSQVSPEPPKVQQQQQPQASSHANAKQRHRPSYTEVDPDQEIRVEPLPVRMSATDNDMWVKVKYNTAGRPPHQDSLGRRSSSSSNLTNTMTSASGSDCYSSLADLMINVMAPSTPGSSSQRRHTFTEGDEKLIIKASAANRDSLGGPDYNRVGYDEDRQLSIDGELVPKTHNYENLIITANTYKPGAGAAIVTEDMFINQGFYDPDMDYMYQDPEGLFHTCTNQGDVLQQVRSENQPVANESAKGSTDHIPQTRGRAGSTSSIVRKLFVKPKQLQRIHSGTISKEERHNTLAPFAIPGIAIGQVNRNYEAFFKTAWGSSPTSAPKTSAANLLQPSASSALVQPHTQHGQAEREHREGSRRERRTDQPSRPHRPTNIAGGGCVRAFTSVDDLKEKPSSSRSPSRSPQLRKARQLNAPEEYCPSRLPSPPLTRCPPAYKPLIKKPSAPFVLGGRGPGARAGGGGPPLPAPRQHSKLVATNSEGVRSKDPGEERPMVRRKNIPPPRPPPYIQQRPMSEAITRPPQKPQSESMVKAQMPYWYRPQFSREEAISFIRHLDPGSFIVRDSMTVRGGYAITIKISQEQVRQWRKMAEAAPVTEDMLVTHFLIQRDQGGVKLQGWNERAFKTLPLLIAHHTVEKICLPCKLVLPQSSSGGAPQVRRKPAGMKQALQTGAVCDLVYLGSVEVSGPGSEAVVRETVEQLKTLGLSTMNIVTFKASMNGITLMDNINGKYINLKHEYPLSSITYCGLDPDDTRWDFPNLQHLGEEISLFNKSCFGLVLRPPVGTNYTCLIFAEFDSDQPVACVVNYIQIAMRSR